MKIKDYLVLKRIEFYLDNLHNDKLIDSNGYSNSPIEELEKLLVGLRKILSKLENED